MGVMPAIVHRLHTASMAIRGLTPCQTFLSIIEPLVEKGAPLNAQTREGSTALTYLPKADGTASLVLPRRAIVLD